MTIKINNLALELKFNMAALEVLLNFSSSSGEAGSTYRVVWGGIIGGLVGKKCIIDEEAEIVIFKNDERHVVTIDNIIDYVDNAYLNDDPVLKDISTLLTSSNTYKKFVEKKTMTEEK